MRETVRLTLWWKESLPGDLGTTNPDETIWVLSGKRSVFGEEKQGWD